MINSIFKLFKKNKKELIIALILGVIVGIVSSQRGSILTEVFLTIIFSFCFFVIFLRYHDQVIAKIVIIAFFLRLGLSYVQRFLFSLPDSTADAVTFERRAWEAAEAMLRGEEAISLTGSYYYSAVVSYFYYLFERSPLIAQFINVLLGSLLVFVVYKIVMVLFESKKASHISAVVATFFPTFVLYSAITMRELVIVFPFALSFYFFSLWFKKGRFRFALLSLLFIFISGLSHGGMMPIGFAYVFLFLFYQPLKKRWFFFKKESLVMLFVALIIFFLFFTFFRTKIPTLEDLSVERFQRQVSGAARDRASYLEGVVPENYMDVVVQTPVRMVYFFFAPFRITHTLDYIGVMDSFLYFVLFILSFITILKFWRKDKALCLSFLLVFLAFSVVFAWGISNYGTAIRHKQKIAFLLIVMASYSLSNNKFLKRLKFKL